MDVGAALGMVRLAGLALHIFRHAEYRADLPGPAQTPSYMPFSRAYFATPVLTQALTRTAAACVVPKTPLRRPRLLGGTVPTGMTLEDSEMTIGTAPTPEMAHAFLFG